MNTTTLEILLITAAALQAAVAVLNLFLPRIMKWRQDLDAVSLLLREVFQMHLWFISLILAIFAVMTWRYAAHMAVADSAEVYHWLAAAIGLFWGVRGVLQMTYYSSSHWRGIPKRLVAHITLIVIYGGMAAVYTIAAFR
jgi:hypothetical protein